jgi:hemin uptake protein HemP
MKSMEMRRRVCGTGAGPGGATRADHKAPAVPPGIAVPLLTTGVLFAGGSEVIIAHGAEHYRLRLTRQNRLILTK